MHLPFYFSAESQRAVLGIEPRTSRTLSENHATRPNSQLPRLCVQTTWAVTSNFSLLALNNGSSFVSVYLLPRRIRKGSSARLNVLADRHHCLFSLVGRAPAQSAGGRGLESHRRLMLVLITLQSICQLLIHVWRQANPATRNRTRDHLLSASSTVRCSTN